MKHVIHIFGASGSGTTTLGRAIAQEFGWRFMDSDDYYWLNVEPKYTRKRDRQERLDMMNRDLDEAEHGVVSGSLMDWGDPLIPRFTLAVRLDTPTDVRIARLRQREYRAFGDCILPGGERYEAHEAFVAWAARYDEGGLDIRSRASHDVWQEKLCCPLLQLDGEADVRENIVLIKKALNI